MNRENEKIIDIIKILVAIIVPMNVFMIMRERFLVRSLYESSALENRIFHLANQIKYNPSGDVKHSKISIALSER